MNGNVTLITAPSDLHKDGIRVLVFDLGQTYSSIVSDALKQYQGASDIIVYVINSQKDWSWIIDKKHKSDLIIFDAESLDLLAVGYFSAQPNSYYFGVLKSLHEANNRAIYNVENVLTLLENISNQYE